MRGDDEEEEEDDVEDEDMPGTRGPTTESKHARGADALHSGAVSGGLGVPVEWDDDEDESVELAGQF